MTESNGPPAPDPQAICDARCQAIDDAIGRMPAFAGLFILKHLDAIEQIDRQRARHMAYVLSFVLDVEAVALHLLSLPVWSPEPQVAPAPAEKVADTTIRGSGK